VAEISRVLIPGGRFVLILRDHSKNPPSWLPNPLSRGIDEIQAAHRLLAEAGFVVTVKPPVGSSAVFVATSSAG